MEDGISVKFGHKSSEFRKKKKEHFSIKTLNLNKEINKRQILTKTN